MIRRKSKREEERAMAEADRKPDAAPFRVYRGIDAPDLN